MEKKPVITYVVGNFELRVFIKVFCLLLIIVAGLSFLGKYLMDQSFKDIIMNQGLYRFILLPFFLAGGIAYLTRHSTLKITHAGKKKFGKLMLETIEKEGYYLKKDKDQVMVFDPENSSITSLNHWMENLTITVKFKNQNMTVVGPRRIMRNIYDKMRFGLEFKVVLSPEPVQ